MFRNLPVRALALAFIVALVLHESCCRITNTEGFNKILRWSEMFGTIANILGFVCIAWGGPTLIMGFKYMKSGKQDAMKTLLFGAVCVAAGSAIVGFTCWLAADHSCALMFN